MDWFRTRTRGDSKETTVTVLATGNVNINATTYQQYVAINPEFNFVLFGFDQQTRTVGMMLLQEKEEGAYAIRKVKSGAAVSTKAFLKNFGIEHENSKNYPVTCKTLDDGSKVLTFTLKD